MIEKKTSLYFFKKLLLAYNLLSHLRLKYFVGRKNRLKGDFFLNNLQGTSLPPPPLQKKYSDLPGYPD